MHERVDEQLADDGFLEAGTVVRNKPSGSS
jgi:hypothetical protein